MNMEMRDLQKMVEGLRSYNRWRRGDEEIPQPDPKEVGRLIEGVCEVVVEFREAIADRDIARLAAMDSDRAHDRMVAELENVYKERDEARDLADRYRVAFCSAKGDLVPQVFPWEDSK